MSKRILGMRPWLFWGAIGMIVLVLGVYLGGRPVRRIVGNVRKKRWTAKVEQRREQAAETPEGANDVAMRMNADGNLFDRRRQFPKALGCYRQALEIARKFDLRARAQASFEMIGNVFDELHMPDSAAIYYQKAQELAEADTSRRAVIVGYWNRGVSLIQYPETNDSAQVLIRRALELAEEAGDTVDRKEITYNLGMSFLYGFRPDSCLKYLRKFVKVSHDNLSTKWMATVAFNAGFAFCQQKEWDSAYRSFASALDYDSQLRNKTDVWLLQQNMDSVRKWGRISGGETESRIPRAPQPRGVTQDFDMYLMGRHGKPVPGLPGLFERLPGDTAD